MIQDLYPIARMELGECGCLLKTGECRKTIGEGYSRNSLCGVIRDNRISGHLSMGINLRDGEPILYKEDVQDSPVSMGNKWVVAPLVGQIRVFYKVHALQGVLHCIGDFERSALKHVLAFVDSICGFGVEDVGEHFRI